MTAKSRLPPRPLDVAAFVALMSALFVLACGQAERTSEVNGPYARHLVLIVLDTARADRMSLYGHSRPTTPYLGQLAQQSVVFERAKSPAPWTVPSHASMFTGLWPAQHQAQWGRFTLAPEHLTLAEVLRDNGFNTVGISANPFIAEENGFSQGFEAFGNLTGAHNQRSQKLLDLVPQTIDPERRNFLFLNVLDAHIPYNTEKYGEQFGVLQPSGPVRDSRVKWQISAGQRPFPPSEIEQHEAAYDAAIRALDDVVRTLLAHLGNAGILNETLFILTSDHGEGLGEHQVIGHSASTWEEQLAVPLLVHFPRGLEPQRVTRLVSTVGVAATATDWLGVPRPKEWRAQRSLFEETDPQPASADYRSYFSEDGRSVNAAVRRDFPDFATTVEHTHIHYCGSLKLSVHPEGRPRLYDLAADPTEQNNIWDGNQTTARDCYASYRRLLSEGRFTPFDELATEEQRKAAERAQDNDKLRSLGYIQ